MRKTNPPLSIFLFPSFFNGPKTFFSADNKKAMPSLSVVTRFLGNPKLKLHPDMKEKK